MITKYLGKTYDSLWKVISFNRKKSSYTLENIYNQTKLEISFKLLSKDTLYCLFNNSSDFKIIIFL